MRKAELMPANGRKWIHNALVHTRAPSAEGSTLSVPAKEEMARLKRIFETVDAGQSLLLHVDASLAFCIDDKGRPSDNSLLSDPVLLRDLLADVRVARSSTHAVQRAGVRASTNRGDRQRRGARRDA